MGILFAVITGFCWASYNLAVRRGMQVMDSGTGYVVTLLIGATANVSFLLLPLPGRGSGSLSWVAIGWFILAGFSTTLLGRWVYFKSIQLLGPSRASAWKNASPLYTLFAGFFLLGESPGLPGILGIGAVVGGLWLMSREQAQKVGSLESSPEKWRKGMLLGVASGMAFSAGFVLRKAGLNIWPDPALGNAIGGMSALLAYLPSAVKTGEVAKLPGTPWNGMKFFVLAGCLSAGAQIFSFLGLRISPAATMQTITSLEPLFTMALSAALLKQQESLGRGLVGSAALVCTGVVLITL